MILAASTILTTSKVFLPAIKGLVPPEMVMAIVAFIDFCYLVRHSHIDEANLQALDTALVDFHGHRQIFSDCGVYSEVISLPCQHALKHYHHHIEEFGAPVGLHLSQKTSILKQLKNHIENPVTTNHLVKCFKSIHNWTK